MASKTYAEQFVPSLTSCEEIQNAGSIIKVANLVNCASEPTVYTLTAGAGGAIGATTLTLSITAPAGPPAPSVVLQKGSRLFFGTTFIPVTVAADTTVTSTPVAVPVDPLEAAVSGTAFTWGLQMILSPTDLPINSTDQTVDRSDLTYSLQGSTVKTGKETSSQITVISRTDDRAFWEVIYPASQGTQSIFAHIIRTGGIRVWGRCHVVNLTQPGAIRELKRDSFGLNYQAPWAQPTLRQYITDTAQLAAFDAVMRLSGI